MKTRTKVISILVLVLALGGVVIWNLPASRRTRQAWKSNTIGLNRTITWTGDGVEPKVWNVRTKVFTDEPGKIRFDEKGDIVVLMPGICVEVSK